MKLRLLALALLTLLAAACNDDEDPAAPATTTSVSKARIASATTDAALPTEINALQLSDADTDETSSPFSVN